MARAQEIWGEYQDALRGLTSPELSDQAAGPDETMADALLDRSDALHDELATHLEDSDADVRQLAALQLEAAAAVDLDAATRLARSDADEFDAALGDDDWAELTRILATPTEQGMSAVVSPEFRAEASDETSADPKAQLGAAKDTAIDGISRDAIAAGTETVKALAGVPAGELAKALGATLPEQVQKVIAQGISWAKEKALALVLKAIRKLLAVFNVDEDAVLARLREWVDGLTVEKIQALVAERLYRVGDLKTTFGQVIEQSIALDAGRAGEGAEELKALAARWQKRTSVIGKVAKAASKVEQWLFTLAPPWSGAVYTATLGLATGYAIFAGGDYLDWDESDGVLDRVDGVGAIVRSKAS